LAELKRLPAHSARLIFTDPPYNIGIDYGTGKKADLLGDDEYMEWVEAWLRDCKSLLTDDGSLLALIGDENAGEYCVTLKKLGFTLRAWIKWYETFGVNCANNFNRCSRHLFYCVVNPKRFVFNASAVNRPSDRQTKYGDSRANPGGKIWDDVWQIPRLVGTAKERVPEFPTQLPLELLLPIIGCASDPGDTVIDPFSGSATTGCAAISLGRKFVGIEKSEKFFKAADKRLKVTWHEHL
jgi:site-specific DNA-methyltransferase (adenine-specific)